MKDDLLYKVWPVHPLSERYSFVPGAYFINSLYSSEVFWNDLHISNAVHDRSSYNLENDSVCINLWEELDGKRNVYVNVDLAPWDNGEFKRFGVFSLDDEKWSDLCSEFPIFPALNQLASLIVEAQNEQPAILEPGDALMEEFGNGRLEAVHLANDEQVVRCIQECIDYDFPEMDVEDHTEIDFEAIPLTARQFNVLPVPNSNLGEDDHYHAEYTPGIAIVTKDDMVFIPQRSDRLSEQRLVGADIPRYLYDAHDLLWNNGDEFTNTLFRNYRS